MTKSEACRHLGVDWSAYCRLERATGSYRMKTAIKIADAFRVSLDYIAGIAEDPAMERRLRLRREMAEEEAAELEAA